MDKNEDNEIDSVLIEFVHFFEIYQEESEISMKKKKKKKKSENKKQKQTWRYVLVYRQYYMNTPNLSTTNRVRH